MPVSGRNKNNNNHIPNWNVYHVYFKSEIKTLEQKMTEGDWDTPELCEDCDECPDTCGCEVEECIEAAHVCWLEDTRDSRD